MTAYPEQREAGIRVVRETDGELVTLVRPPSPGAKEVWSVLGAVRRVRRWLPVRLRPLCGRLKPLRLGVPDRVRVRTGVRRTTRVLLGASVALGGYSALAGVALCAWPVVYGAVGVAVWKLARLRRANGQFGTAAWAGEAELRQNKLFGGTGLGVGEVVTRPGLRVDALFDPAVGDEQAIRGVMDTAPRRETVRVNNTPHVSVYMPTGAGKGQSLILPFLLECPDTVLVLDPKDGENCKAAFGRRFVRGMGRQFWLDPYKLVHPEGDYLNPLDGLDETSAQFVDDCFSLADAFCQPEPGDEHGNSSYFLKNAAAILAAGVAAVCLNRPAPHRSLNHAFAIVSSPAKWQAAVASLTAGAGPAGRLGESVSHVTGRELASSMATLAQRIRFALSPAVADLMARSTFSAEVVNRERCVIYLCGPAFRAGELAPLTRMYLGLFLRTRMRAGLGHPVPLHVVADEARLLGAMPEITTILTMGRGYNIKLQLYYQDESQLLECFPADKGACVKANTARVYAAISDYQTANSVSLALGEHTAVLRSGGTSVGSSRQTSGQGQSSSASFNSNANWSLHGEKLARPEQLLHDFLPSTALVFTRGVRPILTRLNPLYDRRAPVREPQWKPYRDLFVAALLTASLGGMAYLLTRAVDEPRAAWRGGTH